MWSKPCPKPIDSEASIRECIVRLGAAQTGDKMHLHFARTHKSLSDFPATGEIPNFIVLTGENGAGKTQVLEAIRDGAIVGDWVSRQGAIRMLTTVELAVNGDLPGAGETREQLINRFEQTVHQHLTNGVTFPTPEMIPNLHSALVVNSIISSATIARIEMEAGVPLWQWEHQHYVAFTPTEIGFIDPFTIQVGDIFSRYRQMHTLNGYRRWRATEFAEPLLWQSDEEFLAAHGPAPWDLLNAALSSVRLKYQFRAPDPSLEQIMSPPDLVRRIFRDGG
ncbi:MAG: hypothetical protein QOD50_410 [Actinomycetota bacterium]|nr:hypothetical protein [Actinomycetota bacterium]